MVNCHGLVTDAAGNILLTYENPNNASGDARCLIRWAPDGTGAESLDGGGAALCAGTPHGAIVQEGPDGDEFLYHANNAQKLTKTTLDGTIVWQVAGNFGQNASDDYTPTWFAAPPGGSELAYLCDGDGAAPRVGDEPEPRPPLLLLLSLRCDGYGSNRVYVLNRTDGRFTGRSYGGAGGRDQHGKFSTNHGCTYDARAREVAVADRANSRDRVLPLRRRRPRRLRVQALRARVNALHPSISRTDPPPVSCFASPVSPSFRIRARRAGTVFWARAVAVQPHRRPAAAALGDGTLPCNLRSYPEHDGRATRAHLSVPRSRCSTPTTA